MAEQLTAQDARAVNARMVERLLAEPPRPLAQGGYALRVLETRGRRTGGLRRTPLGVVEVAGQRYLVSPNVRRDWVLNLCAQPECALLAGDERERRRAVRVDGADAVAAVRTYLAALQIPWALQAFPVSADAPQEDVAAHMDEMAVFRLDSSEPGGRGED